MTILQWYPDDSKIIKWIAYYYDEANNTYTKYDSTQIAWEDLPVSGVLVIVRYYRNADGSVRVERFNGDDIYLENRLAEDTLTKNKQLGGLIKLGVYVPDADYHPIFNSIVADINIDKGNI